MLILYNGFEVLFYLLVIAACSMVMYLVIFLTTRNAFRAGIITSLMLLLFLFYEYLYENLLSFSLIGNYFPHAGFLMLFIFLLISFLIGRTKKDLLNVTVYLNILFAILILFEGSCTSINYYKNAPFRKYIEKEGPIVPLQDSSGMPDIYYIIFDSYTSPAASKQYFNFANSEMADSLMTHGFFVTTNSASRFHDTHKCISSVLNLSYSEELDSLFSDGVLSTAVYVRNIQWSRTVKELLSHGYQFVDLSFFDLGNEKRYYDNSFMLSQNFLANALFRETRLSHYFLNEPSAIYKTDLDILNRLQLIPDEPHANHVFVYAHLSVTHGPFYFDRNGKIFKDGRGPFPGDEKKNYIECIRFANTRILKFVEKITSSRKPSVIIIQGDHGSRLLNDPNNKEKYSMFNACLFPGKDYSGMNDSISPVNTFRLMLNKYFRDNYKISNDN